MSETTEVLIEVQDLTVDFWDQREWVNVVDHVTFSVYPGETLGLAGESGCGKSTTAYSLLGYRRLGSRFREGRVVFGNRNLLALSLEELQPLRGNRVSLVPQNPATALSPGMRVGDQLVEVLIVHKVCRDDVAARRMVVDLLAQVRLPDAESIANRYPHELSGGQQQRVVIAMALACKPDLLVLDEPTTGLDVTTQAQILKLLARLQAEHGMAMVYVTHNLAVLFQICDRVAVMYAGQLVEVGSTSDLFFRPQHPYTRGLISSVPRLSADDIEPVLLRGLLQRDKLPVGCRFAPRCDCVQDECFEQPQRLKESEPGHFVACQQQLALAASLPLRS